MLTLQGLLDDLGLQPAFDLGPDPRPIRWVHISELEDPTPFLSGGELLLTTGINLSGATRQRRFVKLLADRGAAGIGLGTGFDHDGLPEALRDEAESRGLGLFEVPYEVPFIALTERAFTKLVNEQFDVLERGIEVHAKLERLVLAERGLSEVMRGVAESVGGAALLLDERGAELARHPAERGLSADSVASMRELARGSIERPPVTLRARRRPARRTRRRGSRCRSAATARAATGSSSHGAVARPAISSACLPVRRRWSSRSS